MSQDKFEDFAVVDDGFRDVTTDINHKLQVIEVDAGPGEMKSSNNVSDIGKLDVLLAQHGSTIDASLALSVVSPENLADVGFAIKTLPAPIVMQFTDVKILREFIRRHGLFGVRIAALRNIPDIIKDRLYEQSVWDLASVDYPILLERVQSLADAQAAEKRKNEVHKRMDRRERQRVTTEFESVTPADFKSTVPNDPDDDEQFGSGDGA